MRLRTRPLRCIIVVNIPTVLNRHLAAKIERRARIHGHVVLMLVLLSCRFRALRLRLLFVHPVLKLIAVDDLLERCRIARVLLEVVRSHMREVCVADHAIVLSHDVPIEHVHVEAEQSVDILIQLGRRSRARQRATSHVEPENALL